MRLFRRSKPQPESRSASTKHAGFPYHVTYIGGVHPPGLNITLAPPPVTRYEDHELAYKMVIEPSIVDSVITVECYISHLFQDWVANTSVRCIDLVRALVDVMALEHVCGLTIVLDKIVDHLGETINLNYHHEYLLGIFSVVSDERSFQAVVGELIKQPALFLAVNDLVTSLSNPHWAAINCARCVEGLRHLIVGPGTEPKKAWPIMRSKLNLEESYIALITQTSTAPRHGHRVTVGRDKLGEIYARTITIMDRYLHYILSGDASLDLAKFPLLKEP